MSKAPYLGSLILDTNIRVPVHIGPMSPEMAHAIMQEPGLDKLRLLIEGQAQIIGRGLDIPHSEAVLQELGALFANRYAHINTMLPGVCIPLYRAITNLYHEYGPEVARRTLNERSARMSDSFITALITLARQEIARIDGATALA